MIILDTTTRKLQVLLGGSGAIPVTACYVVSNNALATLTDQKAVPTVTNGTTAVDIVPVPASSDLRHICQLIDCVNTTVGAVTITFRYNDNGTTRILYHTQLGANESVQYTKDDGWKTFDDVGAEKVTGGGSSSFDLTVEESGGGAYSNVDHIVFDGATVTDDGGGQVTVTIGSTPGGEDAFLLAYYFGGQAA